MSDWSWNIPTSSTAHYYDHRSLREQLLDCVDEFETIITQILEAIIESKKDGEKYESISELTKQYHEKVALFNRYLKTVGEHQERERHIKLLQKKVELRSNTINKLSSELKCLETEIMEALFQGEKKFKSVKQSETNRAFSEDIIRLAHLISKDHTVTSSYYWRLGDESKPYPTNFNKSSLMEDRSNPMNNSMSLMRQSSSSGIYPGGGMSRSNLRPTAINPPMAFGGAQKPFNPRGGSIFGTNPSSMLPGMVGNSPRGRPPTNGSSFNSGVRLTSPTSRSIPPTILQRRPSQGLTPQQGPPRISPMSQQQQQISQQQQQQMGIMSNPHMSSMEMPQLSSPPASAGAYMNSSGGGAGMEMTPASLASINMSLNNMNQNSRLTIESSKMDQSSDSSSSSSSGDEGSPDNNP